MPGHDDRSYVLTARTPNTRRCSQGRPPLFSVQAKPLRIVGIAWITVYIFLL